MKKNMRKLEVQIFNLNSLCYQLTILNFEKMDNVYQQNKLENTLNIIKCLPPNKKEKLFDEITPSINQIYEILCKHLESWESDGNTDKTLLNEIIEFRMLRNMFLPDNENEYLDEYIETIMKKKF